MLDVASLSCLYTAIDTSLTQTANKIFRFEWRRFGAMAYWINTSFVL